MNRIKLTTLVCSGLIALVSASCGAGGTSDGWAGTVRDSAGITIVENPAEGVWTPEERWTVREDLRIGTMTGAPEYQFGMITDIAVDSAGRIYAMDMQAQTIRVFDSEGNFLHTIGGPGQGPGELAPGTRWVLLVGDTLYVPVMAQQRVQRYLRDGTPAGTFPLSFQQGIPYIWVAGPRGSIVSQTRQFAFPGAEAPAGADSDHRPGDAVLVRDGDGTIIDTLLVLPRGETMNFSGGMNFKFFSPEPVWALATNGLLFSAVNSRYRIEVRSRNGALVRIITKPFQRRPVTDSERRLLTTAFQETFADQGLPPAAMDMINIDFADYYPLFVRMMAGPHGTLWLQYMRPADEIDADMLAAQNLGAPKWDVFGSKGRYLGTVSTPDEFQPLEVVDDKFYGVWYGELGVPYILRLEIVRNGSTGAA